MREIYLDNSATTVTSRGAAEKALDVMTRCYGNPSSLHSKGLEAERELRHARELTAAALGAQAQEIYFTSGGTEANNIAVIGTALAKKRAGNRIVISAVEHASVMDSAKYLESLGLEVFRVMPDEYGRISPEAMAEAVNEKTILVSLMLVNNEVGSIMPVAKASRLVKSISPGVSVHCDAVQAFGKLPVKVSALGCDLLTVTGHKIHAPKGAGAIYIKKGVRVKPLAYGGEQEKKLRPGTEALPLIAAFGQAIAELPDLSESLAEITKIRDYCTSRLRELDGVVLNSAPDSLPYIVNFSTNKVRSETMLHHLAGLGIYCSSGSACAKGEPSHVLKAMGLDKKRADTALRVSFSRFTTTEDIDALIEGVADGLSKIRY